MFPAGAATTTRRPRRSRWPRTAWPSSRSSAAARTGSWIRVDHRAPRRTTAASPRTPSSPSTARPPATSCSAPPPTRPARTVLGTFGNCAGGTTPWGTVLSGEENFNGYFDACGAVDPRNADVVQALRPRTGAATNRGWSTVDERFDLTQAPPRGLPLRLGRRGRPLRARLDAASSRPCSAASSTRAPTSRSPTSGHAVAYMGDDERGDYLYKFVSADRFRDGRLALGPRAQQDAADPGHALRREVRRRRHGRRRVRRRRRRGSP